MVKHVLASIAALLVTPARGGALRAGLSQPADHLVVPYAAGGGNDVMARTVAEQMSRTLGQQIVVENRARRGRHDRDPRRSPRPRPTATRW